MYLKNINYIMEQMIESQEPHRGNFITKGGMTLEIEDDLRQELQKEGWKTFVDGEYLYFCEEGYTPKRNRETGDINFVKFRPGFASPQPVEVLPLPQPVEVLPLPLPTSNPLLDDESEEYWKARARNVNETPEMFEL
jgi:hypothetical protein